MLSTHTNPLTHNGIFANVFLPPPFISTITFTEFLMALTKHAIAEQIQNGLGFPKNKSVEITETLLEIMKSAMESGDDVLVSGFGKFCVKDKKERKGRNPATGEDAILPDRRVVTFKCSGKLRNMVNGK